MREERGWLKDDDDFPGVEISIAGGVELMVPNSLYLVYDSI